MQSGVEGEGFTQAEAARRSRVRTAPTADPSQAP